VQVMFLKCFICAFSAWLAILHQGVNNGDKTFRWRRENGMEFVRFLNLPKENSAMVGRVAEGHGVYGVQVYDFGREPGSRWLSDREAGLDPDVVPVPNDGGHQSVENRRVAVFVLDVRTNKDPWTKSFPERFSPDSTGDFLGERQWKWFETAIGRSNAAVNIVVTGIQVHAERFYDSNAVENWCGFPAAQHRLHQAVLQPNVRAPILISGDVHKAQLLRKDCNSPADRRLIRPIYEVTTSGMTHAWGSAIPGTCGRANNFPCGNFYFQGIYGPILSLAHRICPWTELLLDENTGSPQYSLERNVAELEMDWDQHLVNVTVLGINDQVLVRQSWPFEHLTAAVRESSMVKNEEFSRVAERLQQLSILESNADEWICVHYRGLPGKLHFGLACAVSFTVWSFFFFLPFTLLCFTARIFFARLALRVRDKQD
jgi:hypothetical protein